MKDTKMNFRREDTQGGIVGGRVGFGSAPALLVIDLQRGFTDPDAPMGYENGRMVEHIEELKSVARDVELPIVQCTNICMESPASETWSLKMPNQRLLTR